MTGRKEGVGGREGRGTITTKLFKREKENLLSR